MSTVPSIEAPARLARSATRDVMGTRENRCRMRVSRPWSPHSSRGLAGAPVLRSRHVARRESWEPEPARRRARALVLPTPRWSWRRELAKGGRGGALPPLCAAGQRPRVSPDRRSSDLDDLVQDCFVQALESLDRLGDPQAFVAWLQAVVVRTASKAIRRQRLLRRLGFLRVEPIDISRFVSRDAPARYHRRAPRHLRVDRRASHPRPRAPAPPPRRRSFPRRGGGTRGRVPRHGEARAYCRASVTSNPRWVRSARSPEREHERRASARATRPPPERAARGGQTGAAMERHRPPDGAARAGACAQPGAPSASRRSPRPRRRRGSSSGAITRARRRRRSWMARRSREAWSRSPTDRACPAVAEGGRVRIVSVRPNDVDLVVESGSASFEVPHTNRRVVVHAARYEVVDLGTRFHVALANDGRVEVDVAEGSVEVHSVHEAESPRRLSAGDHWSNAAVAAPSPASPPPAPEPESEATPPAPTSAPAPAVTGPVPAKSAKELLELSQKQVRAGNTRAAVATLDLLLRRHRGDSRASIAAFELGRLPARRAWRRAGRRRRVQRFDRAGPKRSAARRCPGPPRRSPGRPTLARMRICTRRISGSLLAQRSPGRRGRAVRRALMALGLTLAALAPPGDARAEEVCGKPDRPWSLRRDGRFVGQRAPGRHPADARRPVTASNRRLPRRDAHASPPIATVDVSAQGEGATIAVQVRDRLDRQARRP